MGHAFVVGSRQGNEDDVAKLPPGPQHSVFARSQSAACRLRVPAYRPARRESYSSTCATGDRDLAGTGTRPSRTSTGSPTALARASRHPRRVSCCARPVSSGPHRGAARRPARVRAGSGRVSRISLRRTATVGDSVLILRCMCASPPCNLWHQECPHMTIRQEVLGRIDAWCAEVGTSPRQLGYRAVNSGNAVGACVSASRSRWTRWKSCLVTWPRTRRPPTSRSPCACDNQPVRSDAYSRRGQQLLARCAPRDRQPRSRRGGLFVLACGDPPRPAHGFVARLPRCRLPRPRGPPGPGRPGSHRGHPFSGRPEGPRPPRRTSARRAKAVSPADFVTLLTEINCSGSMHAPALADWLIAES